MSGHVYDLDTRPVNKRHALATLGTGIVWRWATGQVSCAEAAQSGQVPRISTVWVMSV